MMMNEFVSFPSLLSITESFSFHTCPIRIFMSPRISSVCPVDRDFGRLKVRLFDQTSKNFSVSVSGSVKGIQKVLGPVSLCWPVFKDPCSSLSSFLTLPPQYNFLSEDERTRSHPLSMSHVRRCEVCCVGHLAIHLS